jgi:DNA-binding HxlR family transcriptional regulator
MGGKGWVVVEGHFIMSGILISHPNAPHAAAALAALDALDDTIHQKARLGIMSTLLALGEADFKLLKETLALSDGNLSTHLALLEERGYVEVHKEFVRRKPHTIYKPTDAGRTAFHGYLVALERIIRAADSAEQNGQTGVE